MSRTWYTSLDGQNVEKFVLDAYIGCGKIGYVYRAHHIDLPDTAYAVKLTFDKVKPGWDNELKKVSKLDLVEGVAHYKTHGTTHITREGESHLCVYTVWDYIPPGENLRDYLTREECISASFLLAVTERVLHVLHACECRGIARHGDLHAGNILIGDSTLEHLDDNLEKRVPVFVSDFGYGTTGGTKAPKNDYNGLAQIINQMIGKVDYAKETPTHRQILQSLKPTFGKVLNDAVGCEQPRPLDLLRHLREIKQQAQIGSYTAEPGRSNQLATSPQASGTKLSSGVGQFQVSEMIGERWDWWKRLFVPTVPARSKILSTDIPTVVTGPRGCGKTMLFRRLSERLLVECGPVQGLPDPPEFVAFYVNANDIADAFSTFPHASSQDHAGRLICYFNLCVLSDLLAVESARSAKRMSTPSMPLLAILKELFDPSDQRPLVQGESQLERFRSTLESVKWKFHQGSVSSFFPGFDRLSQHRWLASFFEELRGACEWVGKREVLLFVDDYSTPRVSEAIQKILNRFLLQRSPYFLTKLATEAWTSFVAMDSSEKNLQDGDDYQMIDLGEESLFLSDSERLEFLNEVFERRLSIDARVPDACKSLHSLLGRSPLSKTEFARRLRLESTERVDAPGIARGKTRRRVHYFGDEVFSNLWSGDTRTMIQLITDVVDQAATTGLGNDFLSVPIPEPLQDRAFRSRGGEWLNSHTRNEPSDPVAMQRALTSYRGKMGSFAFSGGGYGDHLKAIVEAFVKAANGLLQGPTYEIREGSITREVPRMAFRLEIVNEFRLSGLADLVYRDLVRYGLFMRDNRGKSVRGAFVPRLYLRRLLLPYATLPLSKRDSVQLDCDGFEKLLLFPDLFKEELRASMRQNKAPPGQLGLFEGNESSPIDCEYDDLDS
jgi:hypothetical protein